MNAKSLTTAIALVFAASAGTAAYAQQTPPPAPPTTSAYTTTTTTSHSMSTTNPTQISQKVKTELRQNGVTPTNVNVSFSNGTATLTGTVMTQQDINKAKQAAMHVRGVKHVDVSGLHVQGHS